MKGTPGNMQNERQVSSASKQTVKFVDLAKSFVYNKNNKGPRTEPCGTPHNTVRTLELTPFTTVNCFLSVRYDLKNSKASPLMP